jgi:hypothetical protein
MKVELLKYIKNDARVLQAALSKKTGEKVSYQRCLHELAKQYGFGDWHFASKYAKDNGIEFMDTPRGKLELGL